MPPNVHRLVDPRKNHYDEPDEEEYLWDDGQYHCDNCPEDQLNSSTCWLGGEIQ